jgi:hypothetical protein
MKSLEFQKVSIADLQQELENQRKSVDERALVARRAPQCDVVLLDSTALWMSGLPVEVRPIELARAIPRIANSIAELWRRVAPCAEYLDTLVVDQRGGRQGFPPEIARELTLLRSYYAELHPRNGSGWDLVAQED